MQILPLDKFASIWQKSHPHDVVRKKRVEGTNWWGIAGVFLALLAVNILSASHSIPVIVETVASKDSNIQAIVAVAGFIAIEFTMLLFMIAGKSGLLRTLVIGGALTVAIVANLSSTLYSISLSVYGGGGAVVGIVLGLFAPLANLGIGEVFRKMQEDRNEKVREVEQDFIDAQKERDQRIRKEYQAYLKKQGITNATDQLNYMSGEINNAPLDTETEIPQRGESDSTGGGNAPFVPGSTRSTVRPAKRVNTRNKSANGRQTPELLAERMLEDETQNLTYGELQLRYNTSPNTIRQAKAILSQGE